PGGGGGEGSGRQRPRVGRSRGGRSSSPQSGRAHRRRPRLGHLPVGSGSAGSRSGRRAVSPASPGRSLMELALIVNDERYTVDVPVGTTLLSVLRDDLRFTGTKEACVEGECGACTVLVDGQPIDAC